MTSFCIHSLIGSLLYSLAVIGWGYEIAPPIPVLSPTPGFRYNPAGPAVPKVTLEIYISLNCPDSARALPIVKRVADHYGNALFNLVVQLLPLSYDLNAFLSAQGLMVVKEERPFETFHYIDSMLVRTADFSNSNTANKTQVEIINMLADVAVSVTTIDRATFLAKFENFLPEAAFNWKYSIKRRMAGTPTFEVNGVSLEVDGNVIPTFEEWIAFFDPLV